MLKNTKVKSISHPEHSEGSQQGRSMVEMLGVLAIIGVLSVAGIAGYTTAMRSYKANEIVNSASMLYMMGMAQNKGEGTGELAYSAIGANPSGATLVYNNKTITITFTDTALCPQVKNKLGSKVTTDGCSATPCALTVTLGEAATPVVENCTTNASLCASWQKCENGECVCDSTKISESNSPCPYDWDKCVDSETIYCDIRGEISDPYSYCYTKTQVQCVYKD